MVEAEELIEEAVRLTEEKRRIEAELGARLDAVITQRRRVYWLASHECGMSAMAISKQVKAELVQRGLDQATIRGLGVSHDTVQRALEGPEPVVAH